MTYTISIKGSKSFMTNNSYEISYEGREITEAVRFSGCGTQIGFRGNSIYCACVGLAPTYLQIVPFIDMHDDDKVNKFVSEINKFISDKKYKVFKKIIKLDKIDATQTITIEREG